MLVGVLCQPCFGVLLPAVVVAVPGLVGVLSLGGALEGVGVEEYRPLLLAAAGAEDLRPSYQCLVSRL